MVKKKKPPPKGILNKVGIRWTMFFVTMQNLHQHGYSTTEAIDIAVELITFGGIAFRSDRGKNVVKDAYKAFEKSILEFKKYLRWRIEEGLFPPASLKAAEYICEKFDPELFTAPVLDYCQRSNANNAMDKSIERKFKCIGDRCE